MIYGCKKGCKSRNYLIYTLYCGEGGIRTPGASQLNSFQDCRNRPLYHLSKLIPSIEGMQRYIFFFVLQNMLEQFCKKLNYDIVPGIFSHRRHTARHLTDSMCRRSQRPAESFFPIRFLLRTGEETVLEKNQIESANRDATVSEIEDRSEEQKAVSTHERNPRRPESVNDREVEHVHDTTEHQRSVIEDHTVEKAVDDVAESAGGNQCETDQDSGRNHWSAIRQKRKPTIPTHRLADKRRYPPTEHTRQGDPEE